MSDKTPERSGRQIGYRWILLVVAIVAFGVLMAARTEFGSTWLRAGLAGCAFAILLGTILWLRKAKG